MKIFFKESFPCCNSLIHQDKNSYGLPKWTIKTRTYDNCQKSWTILQFVKFQEKTVQTCRLYYSQELLYWLVVVEVSQNVRNLGTILLSRENCPVLQILLSYSKELLYWLVVDVSQKYFGDKFSGMLKRLQPFLT